MPRKANPAVQEAKIREAMSKLSPRTQIQLMRELTLELDPDSILAGGIAEALDVLAARFPEEVETPKLPKQKKYYFNDNITLQTNEVLSWAEGYTSGVPVTNIDEALRILEEQGYSATTKRRLQPA